MTGRHLLMIPGPIELEPDVLAALATKTRSHLDPEFVDVLGRALGRVREVLLAPSCQPFVVPGSGTLAMELAANTVIERGDAALVIDTGFFSARMATMLERIGARVTRVSAPLGRAPDLAEVERALAGGGFRAITITHVDTSTGVRAPVRELAALARAHDVLSVVDGVCSAGAEELRQDAWDVDIVLTASQKALGAPPGLAVLAMSKRAIEHARARRTARPGREVPSLYLDALEWLPIMQAYEARSPAYFATPAVNLVQALDVSLGQLIAEGMDARVARHQRIARALRAGLATLELEIVADEAVASSTITAVRYPSGVDVGLIAAVRDEGVVLAAGLHPAIKTTSFRIGHMGAISPSDLLATLGAIERGLARRGGRVDLGAGVAAAQRALAIA
jgi:alanine-glyoxylate transaminase/serine-glyoxylate transaminase/serine-pyruvate transaminase